MNVFKHIAQFYDSIYSDKDYSGEVDALEKKIKPKSLILEIGTGTGSHAKILQDRGFGLIGIEPSDEMRQIAFDKGIEHIVQSTIQGLDLKEKHDEFDAAIGMFDIFDYILTQDGYDAALFKVHQLLKPKGLFFMEGWNKDKMPAIYEKHKEKDFTFEGIEGKRISTISESMGTFRVDFKYLWNKLSFEEIHELKPRLGNNNKFLLAHGFKIVKQEIDDYSVKIWLRKI